MSNISKIQSMSSVLSKGVAAEIAKQIERQPGTWGIKSNNEGYLGGSAQSYASVSDGSVAKIGVRGLPIVGK